MVDGFHKIQREILSELLSRDRFKFSQLKPPDMEGSQFTFHLNKLIELDLVVKESDSYLLTPKGKDIANSFDKSSSNPMRQAKQSVVFCAFKEINNKLHTLIYTRKKNPFYGRQGYPTGKVIYGENIINAAERKLLDETGLEGKAILVGIRHFKVYYPDRENLVEDKVMYICRIDEPKGEVTSNRDGEFYWVDVNEVASKVKTPLPEFSEVFKMLKEFKGEITFAEDSQYPENF